MKKFPKGTPKTYTQQVEYATRFLQMNVLDEREVRKYTGQMGLHPHGIPDVIWGRCSQKVGIRIKNLVTKNGLIPEKRVHKVGGKFAEMFERVYDSHGYKATGINLEFMEVIWKYIKDNDMTPKQMAEKIGVSQSTFTRWSSSETKLTVENMVKMADAIGMEIEIQFRPKAEDVIEVIK